MDDKEYSMMFAVEDRHWWYVGMQEITTTLITDLYPQRNDLRILDAGCGTGAVMSYLTPFGTITGLDISSLALHFCQLRHLTELGQASVIHLPFRGEQFDLVTSFDVLCHQTVGDYRCALQEFKRVLKPGGRLFLRLPAYNWLQAQHDQVLHQDHRFTARELDEALKSAEFQVEKISYANMLLFPMVLGKRLVLEKMLSISSELDTRPNPPWLDKLLAI